MSMSSWASTSISSFSRIDLSAPTRFSKALQDLQPAFQLVKGERGYGFLRLDALGHEQPHALLDRARSAPEQIERGLDFLGAQVAALPPLVKLGLPVFGDQVGARCPRLQGS